MREIPSILWYLELTKRSGKTERLEFTNNWLLTEIDGTGSAPVEYATTPLHEIDGELVSTYTIQSRSITLGILYRGARNQREYYAARRRLVNFVRPNQYIPVTLYVVLPSLETVFLNVYATPGAPLPLTADRSLAFLEPVSVTAYNPIWERVDRATSSIELGSVTAITAPNQATVSVSTDAGSETSSTLKVDLGVSSTGSGGAYAGFYVEIKKTAQVDTEYVRTDAGAELEYTFIGLDDQTSYDIRAIAYNSGGNGANSSVITHVTPQYVPPLEAPLLNASAQPLSITLTWNAVTNATGYRVRFKIATDSDYGDWISLVSTTYTFSTLNQQVTYNFQAQSSFTLDNGDIAYSPSAELSFTTTRYDPPGPVRNLTAFRNRFGGGADWDPPNTGGPVTEYEYSYWRDRVAIGSRKGGRTTSTSFYDGHDLDPGENGFIDATVWSIGPGGESTRDSSKGSGSN